MSYCKNMESKMLKLFKSAVKSVNPRHIIKSGVAIDPISKEINIFGKRLPSSSNFHVIGFGKAVLTMAAAVQEILSTRIKSGVISVPENGSNFVNPPIMVMTGAQNNLPDGNSVAATEAIVKLTQTIPTNDFLLVLISGGGSSLLCKPVPQITLEEKLYIIKLLTQCGANISELNAIRSTLSCVKGGGLLKICSSLKIICLILSDVVGDPLDVIASGPFVYCDTSNAFEIIRKYKLEFKIPKHILQLIKIPAVISNKNINNLDLSNILIGSNEIALKGAKRSEETDEYKVIIGSSSVEGLVLEVCEFYSLIIDAILKLITVKDVPSFYNSMRILLRKYSNYHLPPTFTEDILKFSTNSLCIIMGGETTVKVVGSGKGGRNQELSVLVSQKLFNLKELCPELFFDWNVNFFSAGTDGIDGPTDAAGGFASSVVIQEGINQGLDVDKYLANNDCYNYLSLVSNGKYLIKTGHTGTNVMDIHCLVFSKKYLVASKF